jgi:hypothetical protein
MSKTVPKSLRLDKDLADQVKQASAELHLNETDVIQQSIRMGLPQLQRRFQNRPGLASVFERIRAAGGLEIPRGKFKVKR